MLRYRSTPWLATSLLVAALTAATVTPASAFSVTVAWDTLIDRSVGGEATDAVSAGGATFVLLEAAHDCRIARVDVSGAVEWIRDIGHARRNLSCQGIATVDDALFVAMVTSSRFDGVRGSKGSDTYLRKIDLDGTVLWTRSWGSGDSDVAWEVAAAESGIYLAGTRVDPVAHEETPFLRRYDLDGDVAWTHYVRSGGLDVFLAVAADATGAYVNWHDFETGDAWIRRYDLDGKVGWTSRTLGGDTEPLDIVRTDEGLFSTGDTTATLGRRTFGGYDVWASSLDPLTGRFLWIRKFGSSANDFGNGIGVGPAGITVTGSTGGQLTRFAGHGGYDAFVRGYALDGTRRWMRQFGTFKHDEGRMVIADATGVVVIGETEGNFGDGHVDRYAAFLRRWEPA